jgi:uncharacterized membrane protein YcfT
MKNIYDVGKMSALVLMLFYLLVLLSVLLSNLARDTKVQRSREISTNSLP